MLDNGRYVELEMTWWESEPELATIIPIPEAYITPTRLDLDYAGMSLDDLVFWAWWWREHAAVHGLNEQQRADLALIEGLLLECGVSSQ
jgi:hypothetical protein